MSTNNNTNNTNNNTATAAAGVSVWDTIAPDTHGGISAEMVTAAERRDNPAPVTPRARKGEILSRVACVASGWGAMFKYLKECGEVAPKWFINPRRFAFRSADTAARRENGTAEDARGNVAVVKFTPTWRNADGVWASVADTLTAHGVALPQSCNLATAKKVQAAFNRIFCSGQSPAEVLGGGKKATAKELAATVDALREELAFYKAQAAAKGAKAE